MSEFYTIISINFAKKEKIMKCTKKEKEILLSIDEKFKDIQKDIELSYIKFKELFEKELRDKNSLKGGVYDYEIDVEISFYTKFFEDPMFEFVLDKCHFLSLIEESKDDPGMLFFVDGEEEMIPTSFLLKELDKFYDFDLCTALAISNVCWNFVPRLQFKKEINTDDLNSEFYVVPMVGDYSFYIPSGVDAISMFSDKDYAHMSDIYYYLHNAIRDKKDKNDDLTKIFQRPIEPCFDMSLFHNKNYLMNLKNNKDLIGAATNLLINSFVPANIIDKYILKTYQKMCYGTYLAMNLALKDGFAINTNGGFGYVGMDGRANLPYNDVALSVKKMHQENEHIKILCVCLGSKKSVGAFGLAKNEPNLRAFEYMLKSDLTNDRSEKGLENVEFKVFAPNTTREIYIEQTRISLSKFIDEIEPDLMVYSCDLGTDCGEFFDDEEFLRERDSVVTTIAREKRVPICVCLNGMRGLFNPKLKDVCYGLVDDMFLVKELKDSDKF